MNMFGILFCCCYSPPPPPPPIIIIIIIIIIIMSPIGHRATEDHTNDYCIIREVLG